MVPSDVILTRRFNKIKTGPALQAVVININLVGDGGMYRTRLSLCDIGRRRNFVVLE